MEDMICKDIELYKIEVEKEDVEVFKFAVNQKGMPDVFTFESLQGYFKIDKIKKEFRILKRKSYGDLTIIGCPTDTQIDEEIAFIWKVACRSGFKVFLENKYSN